MLAGAQLVDQPPEAGARSPSSPPVSDRGVAGPLVRKMTGTSALAAPISSAGWVLSQPPSSTTASNG